MNNVFHNAIFRVLFLIQILNGSNNSKSPDLISLGISNSYAIHPFNANRLYVQSSMSFKSLFGKNNHHYYPDIGFGYKVSKNLAFEGSVFNYSSDGNSNQIIRGGIQYYFGSNDTLNWVSSLKKVNYKSLKNFNMYNIAFDVSKWIQYKSNFFRFGLGSIFYTKDNFLYKQRGQTNFIYINKIIPVKIFQLGFEAKINPNVFLYSFSLQQNFN